MKAIMRCIVDHHALDIAELDILPCTDPLAYRSNNMFFQQVSIILVKGLLMAVACAGSSC